jgi:hypothetical protein
MAQNMEQNLAYNPEQSASGLTATVMLMVMRLQAHASCENGLRFTYFVLCFGFILHVLAL